MMILHDKYHTRTRYANVHIVTVVCMGTHSIYKCHSSVEGSLSQLSSEWVHACFF